jgi:hypothetical protein
MIKKTTKLIFILFGLSAQLNAQCIAAGPKSPSNVSNDASIGTLTLTNTGNVNFFNRNKCNRNCKHY